jgi:hypothetical protein
MYFNTGKGGGVEVNYREKMGGSIVYKAGLKIPT